MKYLKIFLFTILVSKCLFAGHDIGISNDYTESQTTSINSDFRSNGKSDDAPFAKYTMILGIISGSVEDLFED
ncbi:MAG: hypothetical protein HOK52_03650 [Candidatus Marinimicrobia bacterium]|jgi:hypothetical protein|nr:hypothetical protein [Candidatus Neomarinimicrobiota bacterium]MBT3937982.1 hypothetical protein [Candidatus Neomarinimicrobiota bacterium]MBT3961606.1 hypothetical protein [Candidatus Neomarinimicrobiota bacterium]MBT4382006.1 hypothetical protein [Candidatus Neomarinimicrobiota bacterium]MBT4636139.1 hypothetical protein [Candidatus Neomarinimicrobiota bacterium]